MKFVIGLALSLTAFLVLACGSDENGTIAPIEDERSTLPTTTASPVSGPGSVEYLQPFVEITKPKQGDVISGGEVTVEVDVEDILLVDKIGAPPIAGEGHLIFYRGIANPPTSAGAPATTPDNSAWFATVEKKHTWQGVSPGEQVFSVQLVNNDGTPLQPAIVQRVTVTAN